MATLGSIFQNIATKTKQAVSVPYQAPQPVPVPIAPTNNQPPSFSGDQTPQGPGPDDLLTQLANALSGASRGGSGGFRGSSGSSQAQTNLGLQQTTDLINATAANQKANFGLLAESLQNKLGYSDTNYQQNLQALTQQYGSSLFNLNTGAAASGAFGSQGANFNRSQLSQSDALQRAMLGSQHTLQDSQIVEAQKKAYANALLGNTKLGQEEQMNALQRSEAGMAAPAWG